MSTGLRRSEEWLREHQSRLLCAKPGEIVMLPAGITPTMVEPLPTKTYPLSAITDAEPVLAKGKIKPRKMNKLEAEYAVKVALETAWSAFEGVTLRLGHDCRYTPDFAVLTHAGMLEMHEVKGFRRDDAMVKIRTAAAQYPFRFVLAEKRAGSWTMTEIQS